MKEEQLGRDEISVQQFGTIESLPQIFRRDIFDFVIRTLRVAKMDASDLHGQGIGRFPFWFIQLSMNQYFNMIREQHGMVIEKHAVLPFGKAESRIPLRMPPESHARRSRHSASRPVGAWKSCFEVRRHP